MDRVALPSIGFLLLVFVAVFKQEAEGALSLGRWKREWVIPPQKLEENVDYTNKEYIAKIRSDQEAEVDWRGPLKYYLKGIGATEEPMNLFVVDRDTGFVRITGILDREKISMFNLSGVARYYNGDYAEKDIQLRIKVLDQNDCTPVFSEISGSVDELSAPGTVFMDVVAKDDDEPGNLNSKIAYSIVSQQPGGEKMFGIKRNGSLYVQSPNLDRELQDTYVLTVIGKDLNGGIGGNTGTGTVTVHLNDVNDNVPRLEKDHYEGNIDENTQNVEVMRFKALDDDIVNTENWMTEYEIVSGNEAGYFEIETDPKTNEGVLKLVKPVDYEKLKHLDLQVALKNKADFHPSVTAGGTTGVGFGGSGGGGGGGAGGGGAGGAGGGGSWSSSGGSSWTSSGGKTYPIAINVNNVPEGPMFSPKVKAVEISEDSSSINLKDVIVRYPALDGDTGLEAQNVRYVKGYDPDNWLVIDEETAEVRLNKLPDRESVHLINGTYYAKILCISQDMPGKTATGTIALEVEDHNDHCPTITTDKQDLCADEKVVFVTAEDEDAFPHGAPFHFTLDPEETKGEWVMEHLNDTSVILRAQENLWPGLYKIAMEVADQQGLSCPEKQVLSLRVCTCNEKEVCKKRGEDETGAVLGGAGIGLLILGLLMLLLIPLLLLLCNCGGAGAGGIADGFSDMPFDTKEHLISYHTEGRGEDKDVPVLSVPVDYGKEFIQTVDAGAYGAAAAAGAAGAVGAGMAFQARDQFQGQGQMEVDYLVRKELMSQENMRSAMNFEAAEGSMYDGIALSEDYLGQYYSQKASCVAEGNQLQDNVREYQCEGNGSVAGSVGCCSLLEADDDLTFLNDLGPKFKTLAGICGAQEVVTEAAVVATPPPPEPIRVEHSSTVISEHSSSAANVAEVVSPPQAMSTERSVVVERNYTATLPKVNVQESVVIPSQTYVVQQQPMYYAAQPVIQPMQYVIEPQVQGMYVMSDAPVAENVVLQERRVIGGPSIHGGVIGVQQGTLNRGENVVLVGSGQVPTHNQGMVLLERQVGTGQVLREGVPGHSQGVVLVEGQVGAGQVLQGGQTWIQQGTLPRGTLSGSQNVLLVEKEGAAGQDGSHVQGMEFFREQGSLRSPTSLMGSNANPIQLSGLSGSHNVVLQERRYISS